MQIDRPIASAVFLFTAFLIVFFLVMPQYNSFNNLNSELSKDKAEYNAKVDYYNKINKIYYDLQTRPDDLKKIDDALPEGAELGKIVYYLQMAALNNALIEKNIFLSKAGVNDQSVQKNITVKEITFTMDLYGSYSSLESFLADLEKSDRIFEVFNISFSAPQSASNNYDFTLQVKTYSY